MNIESNWTSRIKFSTSVNLQIGPVPAGFMFIELLVVIAMLAILAAVFLSALGKARQMAWAIQDVNNARQLTVGWMMYSGDNHGRLTPNGDETSQPSSPTDPNGMPGGSLAQWCPGRQDVFTYLSLKNVPPANNVGYAWIKDGLVYPYIQNVLVYKSPADQSFYLAGGFQYPHVRSYSMNTWLDPITAYKDNPGGLQVYKKDTDLTRPGPAKLWVLIDESPASINDGAFACEPISSDNNPPEWIDCPASYDNNGCAISFADGHAILKVWQDATVLYQFPSMVAQGNPSYLRFNPSQNPDTDLLWLQQSSTVVPP